MLHRYWFEFELTPEEQLTSGLGLGVGVTAFDESDAVGLIQAHFFQKWEMPPIRRVVADVDVSTLDQGHVIPNMGVVIYRGIWFPLGYNAFA